MSLPHEAKPPQDLLGVRNFGRLLFISSYRGGQLEQLSSDVNTHPELCPALRQAQMSLWEVSLPQPRDGGQELHRHLPRLCSQQGLRPARSPRVAGRAPEGRQSRGRQGKRRKRCLGRAAAAEGGGGLAAAGGRRGALMNGQLRRPEQLSGRAGVAGPAPHAGGPFPQPLTSPRES